MSHPASVSGRAPRFRCINPRCLDEFELQDRVFTCPRCGDLLDVNCPPPLVPAAELKRSFRQRRLSNDPLDLSGVWRYRELLPFEEEDRKHIVTMAEGNTPLQDAPRSAGFAGMKRLRVKQLGWNPSGSFKDYGMTVAATRAVKSGSRYVVCASTGNTSASMAAYCARSERLEAVVLIPEGQISLGKLSQALDYGALTLQIEGDFDKAMQIVRELAQEADFYPLNSINPFRIEGQKAIVFELLDQLDWQLPDWVVVPGGNLGNCSAIGKGLGELMTSGLIDRLPKLCVVQAAGAAPLYRMLEEGIDELVPVERPTTGASAIKIGAPVSWRKAVRAIRQSGGCCLAVSEEEIADAKAMLGRDGIGCEPASPATLVGLRRLVEEGAPNQGVKRLNPEAEVVAILTGHQLKDTDYTVRYHSRELFRSSQPQQRGEAFTNQPIQVRSLEQILEVLDRESMKNRRP